MSLCTSAIVVMVIRKYSVGHPDNVQQKVQFVKLLGSTHRHTQTHSHTQEYHILTRTKQFYTQHTCLSLRSLISARLLALWRMGNEICIFYTFISALSLFWLSEFFFTTNLECTRTYDSDPSFPGIVHQLEMYNTFSVSIHVTGHNSSINVLKILIRIGEVNWKYHSIFIYCYKENH